MAVHLSKMAATMIGTTYLYANLDDYTYAEKNTLKHKMPFSNHLLITCQSRIKQNFFGKTLRNIDPASSTFTFETQAVFHPAGVVIKVFVAPGKVTVQIRDGGDVGNKKSIK